MINPSDKLKPYSVKLSPMLGCIGVAPRGEETLGSGHLGPFGGNMDSPQVEEGATLYIPVFRPGALLYMGDGHAQQGDGELPGQGLRDLDGCAVHGERGAGPKRWARRGWKMPTL